MPDCVLRSLSDNPNRPCFLLQYGQTFILLDCALDFRSTLKFLPVTQVYTSSLSDLKKWSGTGNFTPGADTGIVQNEHNLLIDGIPEFQIPDFSQLDTGDIHHVLISNFTQIFGLPFLMKKNAFGGSVYATEPTVQLARDVFQDISSYLETYAGHQSDKKWRSSNVASILPSTFRSTDWHLWQNLPTMEEFQECLSRIQLINFHQTVLLENCLSITPYSSGFAMGAANWLIESPGEKICYFSDSSTWSTHILPLDYVDKLKKADVMIVSSLNMDPARAPDESMKAIEYFINQTVRDGGNVLIPVPTPDQLIDILEYLYVYAKDLPTSVPIIVLCASGQSILSLSQVFSEWLHDSYRDKAYLPEEPFLHGEMQRSNRLTIYPSVDGKFSDTFKAPSIVLCTHHTLRFGPAVHLVSQWKNSPKNCVIFTDSEFMTEDVLAPYLPVLMKVQYCPLDTRLKPPQLSKVLEALAPKNVVIHERHVVNASPNSVPDAADHFSVIFPPGVNVIPYGSQAEINLPVSCSLLNVRVDSNFLSKLPVREIQSENGKIYVGKINGKLNHRDFNYDLEPTALEGQQVPSLKTQNPDPVFLLRMLRKAGFDDTVMKPGEREGEATLHCEEHGFELSIRASVTEVNMRKPSKEVRSKIREVLRSLREQEPVIACPIEAERNRAELTPSVLMPAEPMIAER